ncbi:MAG: ABC transporter ATP-binding protein [Burkholderiaceae bacterium]
MPDADRPAAVTAPTSPLISIRQLSRRFGSVVAVDDVSIDIAANEFFALLGPSGCGKTTLLRMIAGLEVPSRGELLIDDQDMAFTPPNQRPVNMVFQSYAVFPHMSVQQNVGYGLQVTGTPAAEIAPRVNEALAMVQLDHLADRRPSQLSGGQRQRVALARALVKRPRVLLLDEPLSALDAKLREQMQLELTRLQKAVGITFVMVTHDQDEALSMADRIAVMDKGRISQIADPRTLYEHPANRFVADFIGRINFIDTTLVSHAQGVATLRAPAIGEFTIPSAQAPSATPVLAIRPEKIQLVDGPPADGRLSVGGTIADAAYYGDTSQVHVALSGPDAATLPRLSVTLSNRNRAAAGPLTVGQPVRLAWQAHDCLLLDE